MARQPPTGKTAGGALAGLLPQSVRGRIIGGFALLTIILVVVVAGSASLTREHHYQLSEMELRATTVSLLQDGFGEGAYAMALLELYVTTGDKTLVPKVRSSLAEARDNLREARAQEASSGHDEQATRLGEFAVGAAFASDVAERVMALRANGSAQDAAAAVTMAAPRLLEIKSQFDEAAAAERQEFAALRARADQTGDRALGFTIVAGVAGAALSLLSSLLIARSILRPLSSLEATGIASPARPSG